MRPEAVDPTTLQERTIGPVTILFGFENGKYPWGNSLVVRGTSQTAIIDPCLGIVARRSMLPSVDLVIHSHTHEDHIAGTHLFRNKPWYAHEADALGLLSIDGLMTMYGIEAGESYDAFVREIDEAFYYPHEGKVLTFKDGHVFDLGGVTITVMHTPGHTRGHCCLIVNWGEGPRERLVYLGDIELSGFGPYYGDAWSDLEDFEQSMALLGQVDAGWWLTFHHKGLIEGRDQFLQMLDKFGGMIRIRENRLLEYLEEPRTIEEIVRHRFVYRPGQTGFLIDHSERRSMSMHLARLVLRGTVALNDGQYVLSDNEDSGL